MTKKNTSYFFLIALQLSASVSFAQHGKDMRNFFDFGEQFYAAAEQNADASSLDIRVNTANALFSFLKTDKANASRGAYFAVRDLSVELREKPAGLILKGLNIRDTIFAANFSETTSKETWNSLIRSIPLEGIKLPRQVEVHIELRDGFLSRLANRPTTLDVALRPYRRERALTGGDSTYIGLSDLILLEKYSDPSNYRSKNWGNTTEFSRDLTAALTIALQKNLKIDNIRISLVQLSDIYQEKKSPPTKFTDMSVNSENIISDRILKAIAADSEIVYSVVPVEKSVSSIKYYCAIFTIPGKILEQGKYRFDVIITAGGTSRSFSQPIELVWHYMPLSLENARDAIPPMMHIMTDEAFKELSSGSRESQIKKLYAYWKKEDSTPETAYNERMDEFYRRSDYAYFNFARNARLLDGAITDRGKIYILFGPPTNIERTFLLGEQPVEIWTYSNNVKKIIKFQDNGGHGEYKLVEVKSM